MSSTIHDGEYQNAKEKGRSAIYSECVLFLFFFQGQADEKGIRTDGQKAKEGETRELGINMGKSYLGKLFCCRRFADLIFSKRDSISSRTLGVYLTTSFTVPWAALRSSTAFSWCSPSTLWRQKKQKLSLRFHQEHTKVHDLYRLTYWVQLLNTRATRYVATFGVNKSFICTGVNVVPT